jgi:putative intracellular protease/amidase
MQTRRSTLRKLLLTATLTFLLSPPVIADGDGRIFMFVRDGSRDLDLMLREEVNVMRQMLEDAGYQVEVATSDDVPLVGSEMSLTPTVTLAEVNVASYDGIILPCMAPAPGASVSDELLAVLKEAVQAGLPIAASRGSVGAVALAGGLQGRDYSYAGPVNLEKRPEFAGAEYMGTGITLDRGLATAGICPLAARSLGEPDGTAEVTRAFIMALSRAG